LNIPLLPNSPARKACVVVFGAAKVSENFKSPNVFKTFFYFFPSPVLFKMFGTLLLFSLKAAAKVSGFF
jgi:hypothetical protein